MLRKTKIVATIGPKTLQGDTLQQLADAGMNIARLNFSHGDHQSHGQSIAQIKALNQPVAIMMDCQGPEIRTADRAQPLLLKAGDQVAVVCSQQHASENDIVVLYEPLISISHIGDKLMLDSGLINLQIMEKQEHKLLCKVIDGGELGSRRHVNLPDMAIELPAITEKDFADMAFAIEQQLDFIALSFVRDADAIAQAQSFLKARNSSIKLIAKIEEKFGIQNLEEIIAVADGVMVARGDLGIEVGIENIPTYQHDMVRLCSQAGKPVIVATHLLESMIDNPIPTRAEVSDVATAVYQQADAIMLSGETSVGDYPVRSVEHFDLIARRTEQGMKQRFQPLRETCDARELLAISAVGLAEKSGAKGVLVITKRGLMASYAAQARPVHSHIFAFTFDQQVIRQLALQRAVNAFLLDESSNAEKVVQQAIAVLKQQGLLETGERLVVLSDFLLAESYDSIQLRTV